MNLESIPQGMTQYSWLIGLGVFLQCCVLVEPSPSDLVLGVMIPLGFFTGLYRPVLWGKAAGILFLLFAYLVAALPFIPLAEQPMAALRYHLITGYLFLLALFLCTWIREDRLILLLRFFLLAALVSFLAGLLGWLGFLPDLLMADEFRVKGLFKDPNVFGPFFVPAILLLISDLQQRKILPVTPLVHGFFLLVLTLGVLFSYSRAAWINLGVGAAALFFLQYIPIGHPRSAAPHSRSKAPLTRLPVILLVISLLLIGLFFSPLLEDTGIPEFLKTRAQLQNYDTERFTAQQGGIDLLWEHPLGIGPGQFENQIDQVTHFRIDAHSLYVRTMVESGLPGLLFFAAIFLLLYGLLLLHRSQHRSLLPGQGHLPPAVLIAILTGLLVNSIVVDTIHWRHLWFFLGLALYELNSPRRETRI